LHHLRIHQEKNMASITIRDLPDKTKELLRMRAAQAGVSLEAYARHILQKASLANEFKSADITQIAEKYFGAEHGVALELPKRGTKRQPVDFES
jgi:plasmid stability protein